MWLSVSELRRVVWSDRSHRQLLLQSIDSEVLAVDGHLTPVPGLVFAGPVPVLSHETLVSNLPTWIFTAGRYTNQRIPFQLPPQHQFRQHIPTSGANRSQC